MVREIDKESGIIYHTIKSDEDAAQAADDIWKQLRRAHLDLRVESITLIIGIPEGHFNENGGYNHEMYAFQKSLCLGILPGFVDKLSLPLGDFDTSGKDPIGAIERDVSRCTDNDDETIVLETDTGSFPEEEHPTAKELIAHTDLKAKYDSDDGLIWGLVERGGTIDDVSNLLEQS